MTASSIRGSPPMSSEQRIQTTAHRISLLDEDEPLHDWLRSHKAIDAGWRCSINGAYVDEEVVRSGSTSQPHSERFGQADSTGASTSAGRLTKPLSPCNWATSNGTDNESLAPDGPVHINPRLSLTEIPEISFITPSTSEFDDGEDAAPDMPPFWSIHSTEQQVGHSRRRSTSESSTASRPMPARSILSSSSSIKTTRKGRSTPSVKFLVPIDSEVEDGSESGSENVCPGHPPNMRIVEAKPLATPVASKKRVFGLVNWFSGPSKKRPKIVAEQPVVISRPMQLCDAPRRSSESSYHSGSSARSVRSVRSARSNASKQSTRSYTSRTLWKLA